jgi:TolB-like protein/Flp pilus assembly protein TadD
MIYEFGPFRLDTRERTVRRHTELVPLNPKGFDILLVLVRNSGRVLTKRELMDVVWPDSTVEESNLARQVSSLRQILDERRRERRFIATVPWRGYRFTATVRVINEEPAAIDSIAVLPFLNESKDPATEYLSDGITESLINRLCVFPHLKVMSRNSVFRYRARESDGCFLEAKIVGKALDVRAVLTGRIRETAGILVVGVELIDTSDNRQLWGAQYKRELSDIFSLQETISQEIAGQLRLNLSTKHRHEPAKRDVEDPEAYRLYLRGRFFLNRLTPDGVLKALELFQQAIAIDPDFALSYTGLMDCHIGLNNRKEARKAAVKALKLDPALGEAHASLGFIAFFQDWDCRKAESEFQRAIRLNPNYAQARQWYALYLAKLGRHEEAIHEARQAQKLDPLSLSMNVTSGVVLYFARQYDRAIEDLKKLIEMDSTFAAGHSTLGLAYAHKKMCDEAISEFRMAAELLAGMSEAETYIQGLIGYSYAACGDAKRARKFLRDKGDNGTVPAYVRGMIHAQLGDQDVAIDLLERAVKERSYQVLLINVDPALDPLRSTRRFHRLLNRVGLAAV